jgi:hypothetical protein
MHYDNSGDYYFDFEVRVVFDCTTYANVMMAAWAGGDSTPTSAPRANLSSAPRSRGSDGATSCPKGEGSPGHGRPFHRRAKPCGPIGQTRATVWNICRRYDKDGRGRGIRCSSFWTSSWSVLTRRRTCRRSNATLPPEPCDRARSNGRSMSVEQSTSTFRYGPRSPLLKARDFNPEMRH